MDRRKFLSTAAGVTVPLLAGCPESLGESEGPSEDETATPVPEYALDRFFIDTAIYNDTVGEYYIDSIAVDGTVVTSFEDGLSDWVTVTFDDTQSWEITTGDAHEGAQAGHYTYGTQTSRGRGNSGAQLYIPIEPTATSGPYSFWAKEIREPEDDIDLGWSSGSGSTNAEVYFSFDLKRETTGKVHVKTNADEDNINTGYDINSGFDGRSASWHQFVFDSIDFESGTARYRIYRDTEQEPVVEDTFDFYSPAEL